MENNNQPEQAPAVQPAPAQGGLKPFGVLWSETWQLYKKKFWLLVGIVAIPILTVLVAAIVGGLLAALVSQAGNSTAGVILFIGIVILAAIAAVLISFWAQAALLVGVSEETISFKEAFRKGEHLIGALLWVGILTGLILLFGFTAFIVPAVIFWPWLVFSTFIVVLENKRGIEALRASREYVRGMWWPVFWRMALLTVIVFAVSAVIGMIPLFNIVAGLIVGPFSVAFAYILYRNVKEVKGEVQPKSSRNLFITLAVLGIIAVPVLFLEFYWISLHAPQQPYGPTANFPSNLTPEQSRVLREYLNSLRASSSFPGTTTAPTVSSTSAK